MRKHKLEKAGIKDKDKNAYTYCRRQLISEEKII